DPADPWPEGLKLKHEKETLGFYITGHPLRKYANEVKTYGNATTGVLSEKPSGFDVAIGGLVSALRLMRTKKGEAMCVILLEDWEGIVERSEEHTSELQSRRELVCRLLLEKTNNTTISVSR